MSRTGAIRSAKKQRRSSTKTKIASRQASVALELVMDSWAEIIQGLIKKAIDGGYQQAKLLVELCALLSVDEPAPSAQSNAELCDILLNTLTLCQNKLSSNSGVQEEIKQGSKDQQT